MSWSLFLSLSPLYLLSVPSLLTYPQNIVTNWIQVGIIVGVIVINTWIGIVQEGSAEKAAEALKSMLSSDARVLRSGQEKMIPAQDLVPGDIVYLGLGDKVPCDLRVINSANLACQEAALTGESVPIDKTVDPIEIPEGGNPMQTPLGDRHNMCFSATLVAQGSGIGIAIATGDTHPDWYHQCPRLSSRRQEDCRAWNRLILSPSTLPLSSFSVLLSLS